MSDAYPLIFVAIVATVVIFLFAAWRATVEELADETRRLKDARRLADDNWSAFIEADDAADKFATLLAVAQSFLTEEQLAQYYLRVGKAALDELNAADEQEG